MDLNTEKAIRAQQVGKSTESIVEESLRQSRVQHLFWFKNYPEVQFLGGGRCIPKGKGQPDYTICISGITFLIEVKSFGSSVNSKTMNLVITRKRRGRQVVDTTNLVEWQNLRDASDAMCFAGYVTRWKNDVWRLHFVHFVHETNDNTLIFEAKDGFRIPVSNGLPKVAEVLQGESWNSRE